MRRQNSSLTMRTESPIGIILQDYIAGLQTCGEFEVDRVYDKDSNDKHGSRIKDRKVRLKLQPGHIYTFPWKEQEIIAWRDVESKVVGCGDMGPRKFDQTTISSVGLSSSDLKEFLIHVLHTNEEHSTKQMISLKVFNGTFWDGRGMFPKRLPETVFFPESDSKKLFKSLDKFIEDKEIYHRYQVPYKQVILLEGLPGTGKTSLACAIASKYQRDLYVYPITHDSDDHSLNNSMASVQKGSVLVLEDIDSIFQESTSALLKPKITLSGITNVLDGLSRIDDLWVILTSNNKEVLPPVLLRSGRVDHTIHFDYIKKPEIEKMVLMFFKDREDKDFEVLVKGLATRAEHYKLVSATCLNFLFNNRDDSAAELIAKLCILDKDAKENQATNNALYN